MQKLTLETLGLKVLEKREDRGVREVAKEIGISPATLSRVERGNLPDLETLLAELEGAATQGGSDPERGMSE